jgi:hypothetical protein
MPTTSPDKIFRVSHACYILRPSYCIKLNNISLKHYQIDVKIVPQRAASGRSLRAASCLITLPTNISLSAVSAAHRFTSLTLRGYRDLEEGHIHGLLRYKKER